jgi:nucleotidyltransferase substrate binding protein (TIGR01987 family)
MPLDYSPLANAIARLEEGWVTYSRDPSQKLIRDGLVQRFEFTYEISHKLLKRYLEASSPSPEIFDSMPFSELVRTANEQGVLLSAWPQWKEFREMRGKTSHTYDEQTALEVVAGIPAFLAEAQHLLDQITRRTA